MKKYLIITQRCPYPPYKTGGVHTIYNILKNIPSNVKIDLFYYYEKDPEAEMHISKMVNKIIYKKLYKNPDFVTRLLFFLRKIPDYFAEINFDKIASSIFFNEYDVVIVDQIYSLPFVNCVSINIPIICMMHDNNILLYERKLEREKSLFKKIYIKKQCSYFKKIEDKYFDRLKKIIYVSELDMNIAKKTHKLCPAEFASITLGVDMPEITHLSQPSSNSIAFSGVMDYGPNEDAAYFFATEIFHKIKSEIPDAKFVIVGKNPTNKLKIIESKSIVLTGFVKDITTAITQSEIYVSPLRYGSGTKNKVLEAMAAGMPVFATEVSREGIEGLIDGENCCYIHEDNMADVIIENLKDKKLLKKVANNGKEFVKKHHSWNGIFDAFILD